MAQNRTIDQAAATRSKRRSVRSLWCTLLCAALFVGLAGCPDKGGPQGPATQDQEEKVVETSAVEQPTAADVSPELPAELVEISVAVEPESSETPREASAQTMEPIEITAVRPVDSGPIISMDEITHDFGEIGPGTAHTFEFTFTNTGTEPLVISQIGACCGVATSGVKAGQTYDPGESGTLKVDFQASTAPGVVERILRLYTNDEMQSIVPLTIQARIVKRIAFEPSTLNLFLKRDNAGAGDIKLTSLDGRPFAITSFEATGDSITADFDPDVEATEFVLKPKADLDKLATHIRGRIRIGLTHPECSEVFILYDVLPEFTISPPQLTMFNVEPGKALRREIWVLGNYEEDFDINSISSERGYVTVVDKKKIRGAARDWLPAAEGDRVLTRYQLIVDFVPPESDGSPVARDDLHIEIAGRETITVPCRGYYKE